MKPLLYAAEPRPPAPMPAPSPFLRRFYAACGIMRASSSGTGSDLRGDGYQFTIPQSNPATGATRQGVHCASYLHVLSINHHHDLLLLRLILPGFVVPAPPPPLMDFYP